MKHENCTHLLEHLSDYLDGEASAALCTEIEQHLTNCDNCRIVIDTLRKTVLLYREMPQPEVPEHSRKRLYASLDLADFFKDKE